MLAHFPLLPPQSVNRLSLSEKSKDHGSLRFLAVLTFSDSLCCNEILLLYELSQSCAGCHRNIQGKKKQKQRMVLAFRKRTAKPAVRDRHMNYLNKDT